MTDEISMSEQIVQFRKSNFQENRLTSDYDLRYVKVFWEVDPAVHYITGVIDLRVESLEEGLSIVHFDFSDSLSVDSVLVDSSPVTFGKIGDNTLAVNLEEPLASSEIKNIIISYQGRPPRSGFVAFETSEHAGVPVLWTLSEPYGSRDWWPCKQSLNDKLDSIDIKVKVPLGNKVASNGKLVGTEISGSREIHHWHHSYPIPAYLVAMAVTNYEAYSHYADVGMQDSLEILNYVYPEDRQRAELDTRYIVDIIELFSDLFGEYPFSDEKYGHAQFGWGGGIEHQTMSFMGGFGYELQAHELAHQWFGDKVTCGSWSDIWLNEGFATYLTGLAIENLTEPENWLGWKIGNLRRIVSEDAGSVFVSDTMDVNRIFNGRLSYSKGAFVLHMLRWLIGDEGFFNACRAYLEDDDHAFGYAVTSDLKHQFEMESDTLLDEFFNDWIYGEGHPSFHINWGQSNDELIIEINQTTSHSSVDLFEIPLPVRAYHQGSYTDLRFNFIHQGQILRMPINGEIDSLVFDPDIWLISADNIITYNPNTSIGNVVSSDEWRIVPNPVGDQLKICHPAQPGISYRIKNSSGRLMQTGVIDMDNAVDVTQLNQGVYFLEIEFLNNRLYLDFVKL